MTSLINLILVVVFVDFMKHCTPHTRLIAPANLDWLCTCIGYITRGRFLHDLDTPGHSQAQRECNSSVETDCNVPCMAKALNIDLTRVNDRNSVWPKLTLK